MNSGGSPPTLTTIGSLDLLSRPTLGFFCSMRCPGSAILETYEVLKKIPQSGPTVIGGFHSPLERQCLEVLIARQVPVVVCLARPIASLRMRKEWREPLAGGTLLLISPFARGDRRVTKERAFQRNRIVAALADNVLVPYVRPGGSLDQLLGEFNLGEKDILRPGDPSLQVLLVTASARPERPEGLFSRG